MNEAATVAIIDRLFRRIEEAHYPRVELATLRAFIVVAIRGQATASDVRDTLGCSLSGAGRAIQRLTAEGDRQADGGAGLLERIHDPMDRRSQYVTVSALGHRFLADLGEIITL